MQTDAASLEITVTAREAYREALFGDTIRANVGKKMHREEGGGGKGDNSIGTAKGLSGGGGARVKGWCERPTCMSNPRILKEGGRGCGIGVESYDRYSYIYIHPSVRSRWSGYT